MAPAVGFEPTTNRLTADRSTTELRWIMLKLRAAKCAIDGREQAAAETLSLVAGAGFEPAAFRL